MNLLRNIKLLMQDSFDLEDAKEIKESIKKKYVSVSKNILTYQIVPALSEFVKHLIVVKGSDPESLGVVLDCLTPAVEIKPPSHVRPSFRFGYSPTNLNPDSKNKKHPVLESRERWEKEEAKTTEHIQTIKDALAKVTKLKKLADKIKNEEKRPIKKTLSNKKVQTPKKAAKTTKKSRKK
jgi:hypothetical protein